LPKEISEMVGDDLRVVAANRQVCPTISEISFGNLYKSGRMTNDQIRNGSLTDRFCFCPSTFGIRSSFDIRHSDLAKTPHFCCDSP